jgi:hypothetical protein
MKSDGINTNNTHSRLKYYFQLTVIGYGKQSKQEQLSPWWPQLRDTVPPYRHTQLYSMSKQHI